MWDVVQRGRDVEGGFLRGVSFLATNAPGGNIVAHVTMELTLSIIKGVTFNYSEGKRQYDRCGQFLPFPMLVEEQPAGRRRMSGCTAAI